MVIQRMALLAGTFVFAGLALYLFGRLLARERPRRGLAIMVLGVGSATAVGTLAKENAALLPALVLVTEFALIRPALGPPARGHQNWLRLLLIGPTVLIIGYLAWRGISADYSARSFDLGERLMTQARILWDYLRYLLLPRQMAVTPFMDGYPASTGLLSPITTLWSIVAWVGVVVFAWLWRDRSRWPLFVVGWFLAGHLIESTVIPLELYYAHRNYVPAFGVYLGAAWLLLAAPSLGAYRRLTAAGLALFLALHAAVLADVARKWGQPQAIYADWARAAPDSVRAWQFVMQQELARNNVFQALAELKAAQEQFPDELVFKVQELQFCDWMEKQTLQEALKDAEQAIRNIETLGSDTAMTLDNLVDMAARGDCDGVNPQTLQPLVEAAIERDFDHSRARLEAILAIVVAKLADLRDSPDEAIAALERAHRLDPSVNLIKRIAWIMAREDRVEEARRYLENHLDQHLDQQFSNPIRSLLWKRELTAFLEQIESSDSYRDNL